MSDDNYAKWKDLQRAAADAMEVVDGGREADKSGWAILAMRAIVLQNLATTFAKSVI